MTDDDTRIRDLREQLTELDRRIVDALNERIGLVAELGRVKEELGVAFLDPDREQWLHDHLAAHNRGPLSEEGLRQFYADVLALTKRELGR
ncbi:MAG TPA: chorismate mutase [Gaiellaceae bacterium]|nr:chorismate mutase [Gaiellaceae bacterium]